jgi:hypothetical protein
MMDAPNSDDGTDQPPRSLDEVIPYEPSDPSIWMNPDRAEELRQKAIKQARDDEAKS